METQNGVKRKPPKQSPTKKVKRKQNTTQKQTKSQQWIQTQDYYLKYFMDILSCVDAYENILFNEQQKLIFTEFLNLSKQAQVLYVRLFIRKKIWHDTSSLYFKNIQNVKKAAAQLIEYRWARHMREVFECQNFQETFQFLSQIPKKYLQSMSTHLTFLCRLLLKTDHFQKEIPFLQSIYKNPLYKFSTISNSDQIKKISLNLSKQIQRNSPKDILIQSILQMLYELNLNRDSLHLMAVFNSVRQQSLFQIDWISFLIPDGLPHFIKLTVQIVALFKKTHTALSFFMTQNLMQELVLCSIKKLKYPQIKCFVKNYGQSSIFKSVYNDRENFIQAWEAFNLRLIVESISKFQIPKNLKEFIIVEVAKIGIEKLRIFEKTSPVEIIDFFLQNFTSNEICQFDWKMEFTSQTQWIKTLYVCYDVVKRAKDFETCLKLLLSILINSNYNSKRGHCWVKLIILIMKDFNNPKKAAQIANLALADPQVKTGKRICIQKRAQNLGIKNRFSIIKLQNDYFKQIVIFGQTVPSKGKVKFISASGAPCTVENYALNWYSQQGWKGFHSQNLLLTSIFGILMWQAIYYSEIEYVFQTPFQRVPLDYKSPSFYQTRSYIFQREVVQMLQSEDLYSYFIALFDKNQNTYSKYVNWEAVNNWGKKKLAFIVKSLGKQVLQCVCKSLATNYAFYCSGMPDLVLFNASEVKFCQVKSTNDTLSDQQRIWIELLTGKNVCVELLRVNDIKLKGKNKL